MSLNNLRSYAIVADVGGTFARFSRVHLNNLTLDKIEIYSCMQYDSFEAALLVYRAKHELTEITQVAVAIACPVLGDVISMTNAHWHFSISELKQKLNLTELKVLNDFNAIAMSLSVLSEHQLIQIGSGTSQHHGNRVALGAGTGLGVSYLVSTQQGYFAYGGEGGHASWGATTEQEWFIYSFLKRKYTHVSYERLLSGHGLENLYQALAFLHKKEKIRLPAAQIISLALAGACVIAETTVAQFFSILGSYAGDLALIFAAFGGIYIAGGIVPRLITMLHQSDFRSRFEEKGRFNTFNTKIPTYVISMEQPGILGAAVFLKQLLD
jgi:glucokinase